MKITKIVSLLLVTIIALLALASCNNLPKEAFDEDGRFDYTNSNMKKYVSLDKSSYVGASVTLPSYLNGSDGAVEEYIQLVLENNATATGNKITDKAIANGDTVALYYEGWLGDEKFEGGSNMSDSSPHMLTIGSGQFIPGFEEGLVGIVPNQTSKDNLYSLHLTFPTDYHSADLAGKSVVFKVYVEYIKEMAPAEYTEEFIKNTLKYTTTATDVKADFERYLKEEYLPDMKKNEIMSIIWDDITEKAEIKEYPQSELDYFAKSYEEQYKQYYQYYSSMFASYEEFMTAYLGSSWKTELEEQCKIDVTQNLIFHYIAQQEKMVITDTEYQDAIQYYVDYYTAQGQKVTAAQIESEMGERMIKEQALWDKVNEFLIENCEIVYE